MLAEESIDLLKYLIGAGGFSGGLLAMYFLQWWRERGAWSKIFSELEQNRELLIELKTCYSILSKKDD